VAVRTLSYRIYQSRNPLHAVSNLTETLIDEQAASGAISRGGDIHKSHPSDPSWSRTVDTADLVSSDDPDPIHAIELCTKYMLALLSDVLDVGRFENGAVKLDNVAVDLPKLLLSVVAMAHARASSKGIVFKAEVSVPTACSL